VSVSVKRQNLLESLRVLILALCFLNYSPISDTRAIAPTREFEFADAKFAETPAPIATHAIHTVTSETSESLRCCDVFIVVTPFENSIGRAAAEELAKQLCNSTLDSNNDQEKSGATNVICIVRCPSLLSSVHPSSNRMGESESNHEKGESIVSKLRKVSKKMRTSWTDYRTKRKFKIKEKGNQIWLDCFARESPILVLRPAKEATDFSIDPFGDTRSIRKSAERCLGQIREELFQCISSKYLHSENDNSKIVAPVSNSKGENPNIDGGHSTPITMRIRGIVFNPYGCPPSDVLKKNDSLDRMQLTPLSAYKLLSIAIFVDVALLTTEATMDMAIHESVTKQGFSKEISAPREMKNATLSESSSLRIIVVGTEAARGLPKMGIPVPNFRGATESTIRRKLLCNTNETEVSDLEEKDWETKYAEMNALLVLYLKALESNFMSSYDESDSSKSELYLGVVSPGMTRESFNIAHVPESGRTLAFRWKLWLCRRRWIFDWLQKCEIAKPTEEAGSLLAKALLNGPLSTKSSGVYNNKTNLKANKPYLRWDEVYPSGSFLGAQSGTGGPLCEQSLLLYNATSNKVGLVADAVNQTNFLGDARLQHLVHRVVRDIINKS